MDEHTSDSTLPCPEREDPAGWLPVAGRWKRDTLGQARVHGVRFYDPGES